MATKNDDMHLSLTCMICLDVASADDAVETSCCHQLFCSNCIQDIHPCPACRTENFEKVPAYFARRLIGNFTVPCPNDGCTVTVSRSNLTNHLNTHCMYRPFTCPDPQCAGFKCPKKSFIEHLIKKHEQTLLSNFEKLWKPQQNVEQVTIFRPAEPERVRVESPAPSNTNALDDRIERTLNSAGRYARLGSTGKFYCGGRLDGSRCSCCNGRCGPSSGCNCSPCMLLDVQKRRLARGWLVNRDGAEARCSPEDRSTFYCGRMVMQHDRTTDGYCGPTNGAQCLACGKLNEQQNDRYGQIWRRR